MQISSKKSGFLFIHPIDKICPPSDYAIRRRVAASEAAEDRAIQKEAEDMEIDQMAQSIEVS